MNDRNAGAKPSIEGPEADRQLIAKRSTLRDMIVVGVGEHSGFLVCLTVVQNSDFNRNTLFDQPRLARRAYASDTPADTSRLLEVL